MKIPKTRIKIITQNDGKKTYYAQVKLNWFFYEYFESYYGPSQYDTIEQAQKRIDEYLAVITAEHEAVQAKKRQSVTYVKYP